MNWIRFVESSSASSSARDPHSSSRFVSGASSSSVSEAASKESRHRRPNDNDRDGVGGHVKWRCFAKAVTSNDILLTFVPNSYQDLKLLLLDDEAMQPTKRSNVIDIIQGWGCLELIRFAEFLFSFSLIYAFIQLYIRTNIIEFVMQKRMSSADGSTEDSQLQHATGRQAETLPDSVSSGTPPCSGVTSVSSTR